MKKLALGVFAIILSCCASAGPVEIVESIFERAKKIDFGKNIKDQEFVTTQFDYSLMSKKILAEQAKTISPADFKWFAEEIREIVGRTVYPKAADFLKEVKLTHELEGSSKVITIVKKRGEESEIVITFSKEVKDWKIVDISIDDESWIENIREQVQKTIKDKKWEGLKDSLEKKLQELKSGDKVTSK